MILALCVISIAIAIMIWWLVRARNGYHWPPGPSPYPIFGNTLQLHPTMPHVTLDVWMGQYGPIFKIYMMSQPVVVLSSYEIAKEALVKHADVFSGRPNLWAFHQFTGGKPLGFVNTNGWFATEQRQFAVHVFRRLGFGKSIMEEKIRFEAVEMYSYLNNVISKSPNSDIDISLCIKYSIASVIIGVLVDKRFEIGDSLFEKIQAKVAENLFIAQKLLICDFIKFLRPFSSLLFNKNQFAENAETYLQFFRENIEAHKKSVKDDPSVLAETWSIPKDFVFAYLKEMINRDPTDPLNSFTEDQLIYGMQDIFVAGFETTASTISWILIYLIHNPEMQSKMRKEIYDIIGEAPVWADRTKLPFTNAVIEEAQRISAVVPLAVFHRTEENVVIQDYDIPKDTTIIVNLWSIMRDRKVFPYPETFDPYRFLDKDGVFMEKLKGVIPFSLGRRSCMGEMLAKMQLFVLSTNIITNYEVLPSSDGLPSLDPNPAFTLSPKPFTVRLKQTKRITSH